MEEQVMQQIEWADQTEPRHLVSDNPETERDKI